MAPIDVSRAIVQVGAAAIGPWATIEDLTSWTGTHGSETPTRTRVLGRAAPYVKPGDDTDTYDLAGLLNLADLDGQNVIRDAKDDHETIFIRVILDGAPDGVIEDGAQGYTQECNVLEYVDSGDADGDYVECAFSLEGVGDKTDVTIDVP